MFLWNFIIWWVNRSQQPFKIIQNELKTLNEHQQYIRIISTNSYLVKIRHAVDIKLQNWFFTLNTHFEMDLVPLCHVITNNKQLQHLLRPLQHSSRDTVNNHIYHGDSYISSKFKKKITFVEDIHSAKKSACQFFNSALLYSKIENSYKIEIGLQLF